MKTVVTGTAVNIKTGATKEVKVGSRAAMRALMDGVAAAADGCRVEPDGHCPHGWPSKLMACGLV